MKNTILLILLTITLFSCKVYKETYVLHQYPVDWYDEIIIPGDHLHIKNKNNDWECLYYETDTVCWHYIDTINIYTLVKVEKVRRSAIK